MQRPAQPFWPEFGLGALGLLVVAILTLGIVSLIVGLKRHTWRRIAAGIFLVLLGGVLGYAWYVAEILLNFAPNLPGLYG